MCITGRRRPTANWTRPPLLTLRGDTGVVAALKSANNIKGTAVADGFVTTKQICTAAYKKACQASGLQ